MNVVAPSYRLPSRHAPRPCLDKCCFHFHMGRRGVESRPQQSEERKPAFVLKFVVRAVRAHSYHSKFSNGGILFPTPFVTRNRAQSAGIGVGRSPLPGRASPRLTRFIVAGFPDHRWRWSGPERPGFFIRRPDVCIFSSLFFCPFKNAIFSLGPRFMS